MTPQSNVLRDLAANVKERLEDNCHPRKRLQRLIPFNQRLNNPFYCENIFTSPHARTPQKIIKYLIPRLFFIADSRCRPEQSKAIQGGETKKLIKNYVNS